MKWLLHDFFEAEIEADEVVRGPGAVVVEGVIAIKAAGGLDNAGDEFFLPLAIDEAGEIEDLVFGAGLGAVDLAASALKNAGDLIFDLLTLLLENALKGAAKLDAGLMERARGGLLLADLIAHCGKIGMAGEQKLENVLDIPADAQPHLDATADALELFGELGAIVAEELAGSRLAG